MDTAPPSVGVPAPADGVVLIGEMEGSGYRTPPALVRRGDGQTIQLTRLLYQVLAAIDGRRDHAEIAELVSDRTGRLVSADDVATLVDKQLLPLGLLRLADGSQPEVKRAAPLLGLRFRYVVTDPERTRRITAPFARLFHPLVVALLLAAFVGVCAWVLLEKGLASATHQALYEPGLLLAVFAVTVVSAGFHEFGHAAAARYGGATPGAMGTGLYLIWPAFYTDVTDSYRLGRGGRVRTDLGGLYFNAIVAVAMFAMWWLLGWDAILLVIAAQVLQMLRQLAPLVRFDGYHVLADLTGVPDLYQHIKPTLLGLLPRNWRKPEHQVLKPWARAVVSTWVLVVVPLLVATLVLMVVAFPRVAGTAWDSLREQWASLGTSVAQGDVLDMAVRLLSIVAIALPLFGMVYIVTRLVRQVTTGVWRSTAGKPGQRAAAVATALAIVAGLAWAWWPEDGRYHPIASYERGTLLDAVPIAAPAGMQPGVVSRATTAWPSSEPLPTRERPVLSVVLVPRERAEGTTGSADTAATGDVEVADPGTWVFPFDRPPAPGEGDNQALAVNTEDGSTLYDVAFALVWADDGVADNVNSAYALASCTGCTTVAVSFQVVLVLGQSDVVPQNLAAAVNYSCVSCVTGALAQQLVLTLDGPLSVETKRELAELWTRIAAYGDTLEGRSLTEIRAQLTEFEREILDLLTGQASTSSSISTASSSPTASPTSPASPSATSSPSAGLGAEASSSPSSRPQATSSATATASSSPSTSPTPSGTANAGPSPSPTRSSSAGTSPSSSPSTSPTPSP
ncbi:MAG TPA: M50 family metallopeptidase [Nocardioidaceae bacterium]|nr:M50 family metallopeptidase [Nocardioidaceae bacterium]